MSNNIFRQRQEGTSLRTRAKASLLSACVRGGVPPVIIASVGRSGSTLLTKSASSALLQRNPALEVIVSPDRFVVGAWAMRDFRFAEGLVYKTHDYPPEELRAQGLVPRVVYVYADPIDVVLSGARRASGGEDHWLREHFRHLGMPIEARHELFERDALGVEQHLNSWLQPQEFPMLAVRYEYLWERKGEIEQFLQLRLSLPEQRSRQTDRSQYGNEAYERLCNIFKSCRARLDAMPAVVEFSTLS